MSLSLRVGLRSAMNLRTIALKGSGHSANSVLCRAPGEWKTLFKSCLVQICSSFSKYPKYTVKSGNPSLVVSIILNTHGLKKTYANLCLEKLTVARTKLSIGKEP